MPYGGGLEECLYRVANRGDWYFSNPVSHVKNYDVVTDGVLN
jgi:hypothetical protein